MSEDDDGQYSRFYTKMNFMSLEDSVPQHKETPQKLNSGGNFDRLNGHTSVDNMILNRKRSYSRKAINEYYERERLGKKLRNKEQRFSDHSRSFDSDVSMSLPSKDGEPKWS